MHGPILLAAVVTAAVLAGGCAAITPPLTAPSTESSPTIEPLRADPDGLEFAISAPEVSEGDDLEIWRRDDEWTNLEVLEVDERLAGALEGGDARWHDDLDERPRRLDYRIRVSNADGHRHSDPVTVDWQGWLRPPTLEAEIREPAAVILDWDAQKRLEARVLRRDVMAKTDYRPVAIVDPAAGNRFVDEDVEPGGVYTYRIRFVDRLAPVPRYSHFVESRYISVPEPGFEGGTRSECRLDFVQSRPRASGPNRRER